MVKNLRYSKPISWINDYNIPKVVCEYDIEFPIFYGKEKSEMTAMPLMYLNEIFGPSCFPSVLNTSIASKASKYGLVMRAIMVMTMILNDDGNNEWFKQCRPNDCVQNLPKNPHQKKVHRHLTGMPPILVQDGMPVILRRKSVHSTNSSMLIRSQLTIFSLVRVTRWKGYDICDVGLRIQRGAKPWRI